MSTPTDNYLAALAELARLQSRSQNPITRQWGVVHSALIAVHEELDARLAALEAKWRLDDDVIRPARRQLLNDMGLADGERPGLKVAVHEVTDEHVKVRVSFDATGFQRARLWVEDGPWHEATFDPTHPAWPRIQGEIPISRPYVSHESKITLTAQREAADSVVQTVAVWLPQLETNGDEPQPTLDEER